MSEFPLDPSMSRVLLEAERLSCGAEMLTIVAMLSVPTVFIRYFVDRRSLMLTVGHRPRDREEEADTMREKFGVPESDHLTLLNVYERWKEQNCSTNWANEHYLHIKAVRARA